MLGCLACLTLGFLAERDAELAGRLGAISDATAVKRIETFYGDDELRANELQREQVEASQAIESMWLARTVEQRHRARKVRAFVGAGILALLSLWVLRHRNMIGVDA